MKIGWDDAQNIQDIYSMNYKLKSQQSIPDENNIGEDQKNFRYNEQYYNIQNNRVMQLPAMELRQQAVDGEKNMEIYSNEDQEQVTRRMNFHFQKKIEADKEGLEDKGNIQQHEQQDVRQIANFGQNDNENIGLGFEESEMKMKEAYNNLQKMGFGEKEEEDDEKLIYHHKKHQSNTHMKTDALGKFFMEPKPEKGHQKSSNRLSKYKYRLT